MNEKYEIIIKENGEETKRVSAKGFLLTAMYGDSIYKTVMVDGISVLEVALLTNANEGLVDGMWAEIGVTSREEREKICELVRVINMAVAKGAEE